MEQQEQDRKANIPNPFGDWAREALSVPVPATYAEDTNEEQAPCPFCGGFHGTRDEDEDEGGAGDPIAEKDLEDVLRAALGEIFPGIPVQSVSAERPALSVQDIVVINAALQVTALTLTSTTLQQGQRFDEAMQLVKAASDRLQMIREQIGSGQYGLTVLEDIGTRLLSIGQSMKDGKTAGLFVAPF